MQSGYTKEPICTATPIKNPDSGMIRAKARSVSLWAEWMRGETRLHSVIHYAHITTQLFAFAYQNKNGPHKCEPSKVEVAGVEPASKQGTPELSTCLADHFILLLAPGRRQPNTSPSP